MSFPSAPKNLADGMSPAEALLAAITTDTPDGYAYLAGLVSAYKSKAVDAVEHVKGFIACNGCASKVLRAERLSAGGLKVDIDPTSKLAGQIMRLLGTDVARKVLEDHFGVSFGLANCCAPVVGGDKPQTTFSVEDQIRWQNTIDC